MRKQLLDRELVFLSYFVSCMQFRSKSFYFMLQLQLLLWPNTFFSLLSLLWRKYFEDAAKVIFCRFCRFAKFPCVRLPASHFTRHCFSHFWAENCLGLDNFFAAMGVSLWWVMMMMTTVNMIIIGDDNCDDDSANHNDYDSNGDNGSDYSLNIYLWHRTSPSSFAQSHPEPFEAISKGHSCS